MQNDSNNNIIPQKLLGIIGMIILSWIAVVNNILLIESNLTLNGLLSCGFAYCLLLVDPVWAERNGLKPKYIVLMGLLVLFLTWYGKDINASQCFVSLGIFIALLFHNAHILSEKLFDQSKEMKNIRHYLLSQEDELSYKLEVEISPNWEAILEHIFKDEPQLNKLVQEQEDLENKEQDKDCLLFESKYHSYFKFTSFRPGKSNINMLWSSYHKSFRNDMIIMAKLFPHGGPLGKKLCNIMRPNSSLNIQPYFFITPYHIGFNNDEFYEPWENYEEMLSNIPFGEIMQLIIGIAKNQPGAEMNLIRKFPAKLKAELDKWKVKYSPMLPYYMDEDVGEDLEFYNKDFKSKADKSGLALSQNQTDCHAFETKYFNVYIKIESNLETNKFKEIEDE